MPEESDETYDADYVVAGFMADTFEPWMYQLPNDDWGVYVAAQWQLAKAALTMSYMATARAAMNEVLAELKHAFGQGFMTEHDRGVPKLRRGFPEIRKYWKDRAAYFNSEAAYDEVMAMLPDWVKPTPRRH